MFRDGVIKAKWPGYRVFFARKWPEIFLKGRQFSGYGCFSKKRSSYLHGALDAAFS